MAGYGDNLAAMKAVLFLDLAVEQTLNVLIADFGPGDNSVRDNMYWRQLWDQAESAMKNAGVMAGIPNYKELKTLREVRNLAQHRGVIPNPAEVSRFIPSVEHMLRACFSDAYGLSFETFQLWDAICNSDLRRLISESQQALELDDPTMALAGTRVAFDRIVGAIEEDAAGGRARDRLSPSRTHIRVAHTYREGDLSDVAEVASQVARLIDELSETFSSELNAIRHDAVIANLGVSMAETGRYLKIRSSVKVSITGSDRWLVYEMADKSKEDYHQDALFSLSYVTGLALLAQEAYAEAIDRIRIEVPLTEQRVWRERRKSAS